jgi:hypothetical protein
VQLQNQAALELERIGQQAHRGEGLAEQALQTFGIGVAGEDVAIGAIEAYHRAAHGRAVEHEARQVVDKGWGHRVL